MSGLFLKVGLDIIDHPKFHAAEEEAAGAVSTWLWLNLHTRRHEKDGAVSTLIARKSCYQSGAGFDACLAALVRQGLASVDNDLVTVSRYAEHNETKEDIDARRGATRERQARYRQSRNARVTRDIDVTDSVSNAVVTVSDSPSLSVSGFDLSSERPHPKGDLSFAPWTEEVVASVELGTGKRPKDVRSSWALFVATIGAKRPLVRADWFTWVTRDATGTAPGGGARDAPKRRADVGHAHQKPASEWTNDFEEGKAHAR